MAKEFCVGTEAGQPKYSGFAGFVNEQQIWLEMAFSIAMPISD